MTVVNMQWFGSEALGFTYKVPAGKVAKVLFYRHDERGVEPAVAGRPWSFDGDGELFRLVSEAHRVRMAHLFDPMLAVHTSRVAPLPHRITEVCEATLPRQPLRFLLADDQGADKPDARVNSKEARRRADNLQARLQERMKKFDLESQISALLPVLLGGLIVVLMGLLAAMTGAALSTALTGGDRQASAVRARAAVTEIERSLGFDPTDREFERKGYDIESRDPTTGKPCFFEVEGRNAVADTITVTRNEILYSLNKPEEFILAIVKFKGDDSHRVRYLRRPFQKDPDFGVISVNDNLPEILARAEASR